MKFMTKTLKVASTLAFVALFFVGVRPINAQIADEGRAEKAVWSGYWWPTAKQEIVEPLKKYDKLTNSRSAEYYKTDNQARGAAGWEGLCHAWSAASVMEIEPKKPVRVGRTTLGVGDQKAWLTICHDDDVSNFYGDRYGDGIGSEDLQDIRPDELWTTLRSHLRERKIPVVADIACGKEVWNYPIYAYRVQIQPVDGGSLHRGTFEIWLADDAVPADFVGIKKAYKKYTFEVEVRNGSIIMGSGKWIGASVKDHPDFIWVPYIVQTSNPGMDYAKVCELLGRDQAEFPDAPQEEEHEEPAPENGGSSNDETENNGDNPNDDDNDDETPNDDDNNCDNPNDDETPNDNGDNPNDDAKQERLRKFVDSLEDCKTNFTFSLIPQPWQPDFFIGDALQFRIIAECDGYLSVFSVNPDGSVKILYPAFGVDNRWTSNSNETIIPDNKARVRWRAIGPIGEVRVIAVISAKPLNFDVEADGSAKIAEDPVNENDKPRIDAKNEILGWQDTTINIREHNKPNKGKK